MAVTASVAEEEVYPKIENIGINEGEKVIELKWNRDYYKNYYSGFYIYRSADEGRNCKNNRTSGSQTKFQR